MATPFLSVKDSRPLWAEKIGDYRRPILLDLSSETICEPRGRINTKDVPSTFRAIDQAVDAQRQADQNPADLFAQIKLADYLLDLRFFKDAERTWLKILFMPIENPAIRSSQEIAIAHHRELARASLCAGNLEGAIRTYRDTLELGGKNNETYFGLGLALYYHLDFSEAFSAFNQADTFSANSYRYLFYLALSQHAQGDYHPALLSLDRMILQTQKEHPLYSLEKALKKHYPSSPFLEALNEIKGEIDSVSLEAVPTPALWLFVSSLTETLAKKLRSQKRVPNDVHLALREIDQNLDLFAASSQVREKLASFYYYRGIIYRDANKPKTAIDSFQRALSFDKNLNEARKAKEEIEEGLKTSLKTAPSSHR